MIKDYFSQQSKLYAAFRPTYPDNLYEFIFQHLKNHDVAWDCATGNGQVAQKLATVFSNVFATDISQQQIDEGFSADNIFYSVGSAEKISFDDHQFDLITVGQALHWINTADFYKEVNRTAKQGALLAVWGYSLLRVNPKIDDRFEDFYFNIVGPYWDAARKLVEQKYKYIPFPFEEIRSPEFFIEAQWSLDQFSGYLSSWSSTRQYIKENGKDPVPEFIETIKPLWKTEETKAIRFPVFLKLGKVHP
jgi:ubiquinone/menaquinone biosynthesis C-methylase UbiE